MLYNNIPSELKDIPAWICWKLEDIGAKRPTKVPYDSKTGKLASTTDPQTWTDFATAISHVYDYSGIGFVFSDNDPYSFIDLDNTEGDQVALDRQIKIFQEFNSYSEISPSGSGLHIIVKGIVPAGRRRSFVEIYSSGRYATFTGNCYPDVNNPKPIIDCQDKLLTLWQQMGEGKAATYIYEGSKEQKHSDKEILDQAKTAHNKDKFIALFEGNWQSLYGSQSEADFALIDMLAFYTQNKLQITRLFYHSALGKREKAKRKDYIQGMILRSFDKMLPSIDIDGFQNALELKLKERFEEAQQLSLNLQKLDKLIIPDNIGSVTNTGNGSVAQRSVPAAHNGLDVGSNPAASTIAASSNGKTTPFEGVNIGSTPIAASTLTLPPGLMGEIAHFIYSAAPHPVPEIALAAAIGLMAGIAGRAYNVNGEGLNQYVLLVAKSGTGKEAMASGIDKLMNAIKMMVPTANGIIGPAEISSGEALVKYINKNSQCFVSIMSEFGYRLQSLTDKRNASQRTLKQMLLDLYHKSGHGRTFRSKIYSEREKNIEDTQSPSFSILAETTPSTLYDCISEEMIVDGLLPRFTIIEYKGPRTPLNENCSTTFPSTWLIDRLATFVANCETINYNKKVLNIRLTDEAQKRLKEFEVYTTDMINYHDKEDIRQLWNRAHLKAWKLSGSIAVGVNMYDPVITLNHLEWALDFVQNDVRALSAKFESGEIGGSSAEIKQQQDMIKIIKQYLTSDESMIVKYKIARHLHYQRVIPYQYLSRRLMAMASFRNDHVGATGALKRAIQVMLDSDLLREINKNELAAKYGTSQRAFIISDVKILD